MKPRKLTSADIDRVRDIEGFPIATDEAIMELSDAPYYTACPNPFIADFVAEHGTPYEESIDSYQREPFTADVSEGKNDPIYMAHSYHTKVPYKAILRYILHYTKPGDLIYDGFCGTGMTGVAAKMAANPHSDDKFIMERTIEGCEWGTRYVILGDISPAATFIASNLNAPCDVDELEKTITELITSAKQECNWLYETNHVSDRTLFNADGSLKGIINYIVWSDVFICPHCSSEYIFWDAALNKNTHQVENKYTCPNCGALLSKNECAHAMDVKFDVAIGTSVSISKQVPVLINYTYNGKRFEKTPDEYDLELIDKIDELAIPYWFPSVRMREGREARRNDPFGITHAHQFYTKRTLYVLAKLWDLAGKCKYPNKARFIVTGIMQISSKQSAFRYDSRNPKNTAGGILKGTLYIPSISRESNLFSNFDRRYSAIQAANIDENRFSAEEATLIQIASATDSGIPDNSVDYIFTDPPFGSNIDYSELNFTWESWLQIVTNNGNEAIINKSQNKGLSEYQSLMTRCFRDYYRVLKPGRWMTVEFHNSKNAVWNAIQDALQRAGFIVADVRTLDKKQGSFKQVTSYSAVKQDLIISAYKPKEDFVRELGLHAGSEETAWAFVRQYLENLPVVVMHDKSIELIAERQAYLLFDRMVAYHVTQGIPIPIDSTDFYHGLDERFLKRDDMYFMPDQVTEYDTARMKMDVESIQFALLVTNEKTAIGWLYQLLASESMTYQQIQPKFMQEVKAVDRYEAMPELAVLLEENFLQDDNGRWYVPDTKKEGDIAKLREKSLLREFDGYLKSKGKLKLFRSEAIRVGFSHLWKDKNYQAIVDLANRLPAATIQEDPNLLMYYDISLSRVG